MNKRDRDELDAHIAGDHALADDELEALIAEETAVLDEPPAREIAHELHVQTYDEPPSAGDRETWAHGTRTVTDMNGVEHQLELRLDSGAGMGSTHLSIAVDIDGEVVAREYIDVSTLIVDWTSAIFARWDFDRHIARKADDAIKRRKREGGDA